MNPLSQIDFYKADHRSQYPEGTSLVFSNLTPRSSRLPGVDKVVFFGLNYYLKEYLQQFWNDGFFLAPKTEAVEQYRRRMTNAGISISYEHVEELWEHGCLPIQIWSVDEGSSVDINVPMLVMWNTAPEFFWLTNYLETSISQALWGPCTSATIAREYRKLLIDAARHSGGSEEFVNWQGHDFSMRGMYGFEASMLSGAGHLLSFTGTDTVPAIDFLEKYYGANSDNELIGGSVAATEHSVMCMGSKESELETYRRLITEIYPSGIVSVVSDTWDYWKVWTEILPALKEDIMSRDGTLTIRPDSGDPVKIICGDPDAPMDSPAYKGSFTLAYELFGGTENDKGYIALDPHINLIYGDSITLERCSAIINGLMDKGFVPSMVFGIGSYTYQYNTRDTFGFAVKATYGEVNGEARDIFKDPQTDSNVGGSKKSAKGLLAVSDGKLQQQVGWDDVMNCDFKLRFKDGYVYNKPTLEGMRKLVQDDC